MLHSEHITGEKISSD